MTAQSCEVPATKADRATLEISIADYKAMRDAGKPHVLLDVRAPGEAQVCKIDGSVLIPVGELEQRLGEVPKGAHVVAHCKGGGRSLRAAEILRAHGFDDALSLKGGIIGWIDQVDPKLSKY